MENQLSRIASFIDSLNADSCLRDEESFLLSTDLNAIGGDNGKNCVNSAIDSCEGVKNGGNCANYLGMCGGSDNKGDCINVDFGLINPPHPENHTINCD